MASKIVVEEEEGLCLPSEFPYDLHETPYDAVDDMTLRFAGKLKLRAVGWPVKPIVGPGRNTAAQPKTTNPSVFHHMQLQRQMYLYEIRRAEELKIFQHCPTRSIGSGLIGGKRACAGTGVFLPRTYENRSNRNQNHCDNGHSSHSPIEKSRAYGQIGKNLESTGFDFPHYRQQMQSPINKAMTPDYDSMMVRRHVIMLQQRSRLLSDEKSSVVCLPQEWTY